MARIFRAGHDVHPVLTKNRTPSLHKKSDSPMRNRKNNFDFIRVFAALCVLVSHQFALSGLPEPSVLGIQSLGGLGVLIFFSISGYLVAQSWDLDPSVWRFSTRRFLRIWPGYAVAIILTATVLGPMVSSMHWRDYYTHQLFRDYFLNLRFELRDELPIQFPGNKLPNAINGSLWTIPLELKCYVALTVLGFLGILRRNWLLPILTVLSAAATFFYINPQFTTLAEKFHLRTEDGYLVQFGMFFFAGAALHKLKVTASSQMAAMALAIGSIAATISYLLGNPLLALWLIVPVATIAVGSARTPGLREAGRFGDISFGLYIYAFPVQQVLIWALRDQLSWWGILGVTIVTTSMLAFASWHILEKRVLKLKPKAPKLQHDRHTKPITISFQRWGYIAAAVAFIFALTTIWHTVGRDAYMRYSITHNAGCSITGSLDRVVSESFGSNEGLIVQGWVVAPNAVLQIDGTGPLMKVQPNEKRSDVAAVFPECSQAEMSGFSVRLPDESKGKTLQLLTRTNDGMKSLDKQKLLSTDLRLELDSLDPIVPNGRNILSGWALSADNTPVKVEVIAGGKIVASMLANLKRSDVASAFPKLPNAIDSGFEIRIPYFKLPRGIYKLTLRATTNSGGVIDTAGPEVRNAHAYGLALTVKDRVLNPGTISVRMWVAHESGIKMVTVQTSDGTELGNMLLEANDAKFGVWSKDVVRDMIPPIGVGSMWKLTVPNRLSAGVHRLQAVVTNQDGNTSIVPAQLVVNDKNPGSAHPEGCKRAPLYVFYPAGPGTIAGLGPQREAATFRNLVEGPCVHVGMRLRVEYLRTTKGQSKDFAFDPYFMSTMVKVNGRNMTGSGLDEALKLAKKYEMPVLISLDGGVWADSAFPAPEWDVVDNLENDESAVQWNQFDKSEKDDALSGMSGATGQPQLARMMSLNIYNDKFRTYKKRNLQAAVRHLVAYQRQSPKHVVWVNFDSDNYINPWFKDTQWYDYNPDTLRQFREWLTGTGVYAPKAILSGMGLSPTLDLMSINKLAKRNWKSVGEVAPPRGAIDIKDQWHAMWVRFKRHLVALHYDDLSRWACEAGMASDRIYTAVGISDGTVAQNFDDAVRGWNDQSGVSLSGGKPSCGHLGIVIYGPATRNEDTPPSGKPLLGLVAEVDPGFGVVEFHAANLDLPTQMPSLAEARKSLQSLLEAGARFISPMWGSIASGQSLFPEQFHAYESMEGTEFEEELVRTLRSFNSKFTSPQQAAN